MSKLYILPIVVLIGCADTPPEPKINQQKQTTKVIEKIIEKPVIKIIEKPVIKIVEKPVQPTVSIKRFEGRITDYKTHRTFTATCEARDTHNARQILESQHKPSKVDFVREISK